MDPLTSDWEGWQSDETWEPGPWSQAHSLRGHLTPFALGLLHSLLLGLRSNLGLLGPWCFLTVGETTARGLRDTQSGWLLPPGAPATAAVVIMGLGMLGAVESWSRLRWAHDSHRGESPLL